MRQGIFDEATVSVIASETVSEIGRLAGRSLDIRRFRPNILVRLLKPGAFQEDEWLGGALSFGQGDDAPAIAVTTRDGRCSMLNLDPDSAGSAPEVMKAVVRANQNKAGIYGTVTRIGRLAVGQSVLFRAAAVGLFLSVAAWCGAGQGAPPPPTPEPERVLPHQTWMLDSKVLGETRRIHVYTPPGYAAAAGARYPVLYMPDGGLEEDFPHVTNDVDAAIRAGEMRPVIVVGIENTERRRDMTGPTDVDTDKKIAPHVGGSSKFRAFIRDELMPVVRERVRGNGRTAIVGESLAGLFVVETFFDEPRLFDTYIALSPSLWWNGQALVRAARRRLETESRTRKTLYLAVAGDDDRGDAVKALAAVLRDAAPKDLTWYFEPRPDLQHSTIYRGASPGAFRKLFPPG